LLKDRGDYKDQSVWRFKNGSEELVRRLVEKLSAENNVKLHLNEPIEKLEIDNEKFENSVKIKSKTREDTVDIVISSVYSKCKKFFFNFAPKNLEFINAKSLDNCQFLSEKHSKLKKIFDKIEAVNMVVINFYFKTDILPVKVLKI
jgi:hypothetical protein